MNLKEVSSLRMIVYAWRNLEDNHSYIKGQGNQIIREGVKINSRIQVNGRGNKILFEKGSLLKNSRIRVCGNNNSIIIHHKAYISGVELWIEDSNCLIEIGECTFIGENSHLACTEDNSKLIVGADCMISANVQIRTGDSHSILDNNGKRINSAMSVNVGNHVWIGDGARVLKGVTLEGDDIVSTGAIVTKSFGKNMLLGGIPAKVLKENVTWDKERI